MFFTTGLATMSLSVLPSLARAQAEEDVRFEDRPMATVPAGISLEGEPMANPNGGTIEVRARIHWSPDGRQVAYVGFKDGQRCAVIGDHVSEPHDYADSVSFGDSGDDVVFRVGDRVSKTKEKWFLYRGPDQKKRPKKFDWIGAPSMAPDGSRVVVWNQPGAKMDKDGYYLRKDVVLFGGWKKKAGRYDDGLLLSPPVFSDDSSRVFSAMQQHGAWLLLMVHKKGEEVVVKDLMSIADFAVSPSGKDTAVSSVVYAFSGGPNEESFSFGGMPKVGSVEILSGGDVIGKDFDAAWSPTFSPDGKQLAYKVMGDDRMGVSAGDAGNAPLEWDFVTRPVFSPDSQRVAFAGSRDTAFAYGSSTQRGAQRLPRTGKEQVQVFPVGRPHECQPVGGVAERIERIQFGPKEDLVAYAAKTGDGWRVHCGDRSSDPYDEVGPLHFDEKGTVIGFGARSGRELLWRTLILQP